MEPAIALHETPGCPRGERAPFAVPVRCITPLGKHRQYLALDLSEGGIFLKTLLPLTVGMQVSCALELPDGQEPLQTLAEVVWCRAGADVGDEVGGMGLRFLTLDLDARDRIRAFADGA